MRYQAHKGVSTENPENTMPAFAAALRQGYDVIETDVAVTADMQFVLLHDAAINRTARLQDGEELGETVKIGQISYEEALKYDFGIGFSKKFRGTRIPLLKDVLRWARENELEVKIDNRYQSFAPTVREAFFRLLEPYETTAALTCFEVEEIQRVHRRFPRMQLHYDGEVSRESLEALGSLVPKEQLTVWLPLESHATAWVKVPFASEERAGLVKRYARLGLWILSREDQLDRARRLGAEVIETNGQLKPERNKGMTADLHTHSESSHDSVCRIEEMREGQRKKGTEIFAVTDHFDSYSVDRYDIFTPIQRSEEAILRLRREGTPGRILMGIEMSEAFWYPEIGRRGLSLARYDVVLGSVHLVRSRLSSRAYSGIDFSRWTEEEIHEYLGAYFDDVLTLVEQMDFDVLAHLTCPLRYINGKYRRGVSTEAYRGVIENILSGIIKRGIALEVNTSAAELLGDWMPSEEILRLYGRMGGYLLTLGSDAHEPKAASRHFSQAVAALRRLGFGSICYFENRNLYQITI